ncbi:MarR family transcriptional regulator [Streptomyces sp. V4-01]|uniref:MarR family transcriptional regulator n=1 Tax=Actinacidiphila polyblastidii TaxID=3110430 RepID=A0ABU7PAL3_9ACTN|nr:MarR family transcriptional regulator [Streptomyces sp. V4-01]
MASQDREHTADELATAVALLSRRMRAASAEDSLTPSQVSVMSRLATSGPATTADLARDELVRPQSMRMTLSALEERGLVSRAPHSTDGRQVVFSLTEQGAAVRGSARRARRGWLTRAMEHELTAAEAQALADVIPLLRRLVRS